MLSLLVSTFFGYFFWSLDSYFSQERYSFSILQVFRLQISYLSIIVVFTKIENYLRSWQLCLWINHMSLLESFFVDVKPFSHKCRCQTPIKLRSRDAISFSMAFCYIVYWRMNKLILPHNIVTTSFRVLQAPENWSKYTTN